MHKFGGLPRVEIERGGSWTAGYGSFGMGRMCSRRIYLSVSGYSVGQGTQVTMGEGKRDF